MSKRVLTVVVLATLVVGLVALPAAGNALAASAADIILPQNNGADQPGLLQNLRVRVALRKATAFLGGRKAVQEYLDQGYTIRDLVAAAALSKASQESVEDVLALKTDLGDWKSVAQDLGVTLADLRDTLVPPGLQADKQGLTLHQKAVLTRIGRLFDGDRETIQGLRDDGWRPREIAAIGVLHQLSGDTVQNVAALKTDDNTWNDVAGLLNVETDTFRTYVSIVVGP